jgi:hypothetical protein
MPGVRCLRTAVSTLVLVWQNGSGSANGPLARCTSRCRKMCERLFQNHEDEVLSAIVECAVSDEGAMLVSCPYPSPCFLYAEQIYATVPIGTGVIGAAFIGRSSRSRQTSLREPDSNSHSYSEDRGQRSYNVRVCDSGIVHY